MEGESDKGRQDRRGKREGNEETRKRKNKAVGECILPLTLSSLLSFLPRSDPPSPPCPAFFAYGRNNLGSSKDRIHTYTHTSQGNLHACLYTHLLLPLFFLVIIISIIIIIIIIPNQPPRLLFGV